MAIPYIGEVRVVAGSFVPDGWLPCDGSRLPIAQYQALFSVIRTRYGGDGRSDFAVPDLRGRVPMHAGNGTGLTVRQLGATGGSASVALSAGQLPSHTHRAVGATTLGTIGAGPAEATWANSGAGPERIYSTANDAAALLAPTAIEQVGQSAPHNNLQPYLCLTFCVAYDGDYPTADD